MNATIRPVQEEDLPALQDLTEYAFEPIFASFESLMGTELFMMVYPDWRRTQRNLVMTMFQDEKIDCWLAIVDASIAGLVTIQLKPDDKSGEIYFLVVHRQFQNQGIGAQLIAFALKHIKNAGMELATVSTGGDPSHAPARAAYEKAGFVGVPSVWYAKKLT